MHQMLHVYEEREGKDMTTLYGGYAIEIRGLATISSIQFIFHLFEDKTSIFLLRYLVTI